MSDRRTDFLDGTEWRVARVVGQEVESAAPNTIQFSEGRVSGQAGMNRFTGSYSIEDGRVVISPMASTMMAGPDHLMELERKFFEAVEGAHSIQVAALRLGTVELVRDGSAQPAVSIRGTAVYRERLMAPPGSIFTVELQDVSRADAAADIVASHSTYADSGPPYEFELTPGSPLDPGRSYAVRAAITGPDGSLMWTTDTHVEPSAAPLELMMVMTGSG